MNDYGIVISEEGYDADNCAPENTIFDTRFNTFKALVSETVMTVGNISFVFTTTPPIGTTRLFTVKHDFGYTPAYLAYYDATKSTPPARVIGYVAGHFYVSPDPFGYGQILVKTNDTELWFELLHTDDSMDMILPLNMVGRTLYFKYYIFCEDVRSKLS